MCGDSVLVENYMEGDGSLRAEKEKEEEANEPRRKQNLPLNPKRIQTQV